MCHRTEIQILLGLKTTGRFGSKIHFTPADTLWTIHTSQVVWVRFYSLSPRVRTKHGEEEFGFYASHSWAEKHFAHVFHETGEYERGKLIWHCKKSCTLSKLHWQSWDMNIFLQYCASALKWAPKKIQIKWKKTQQDCSTEGLDISVCYNLVINEIISHIKRFTHFLNTGIFYFFIVSHLILL